jgi:hypothetical protein
MNFLKVGAWFHLAAVNLAIFRNCLQKIITEITETLYKG